MCDQKDSSAALAGKHHGNHRATAAMFYSDLAARDRDNQLEDERHIHKIIEL